MVIWVWVKIKKSTITARQHGWYWASNSFSVIVQGRNNARIVEEKSFPIVFEPKLFLPVFFFSGVFEKVYCQWCISEILALEVSAVLWWYFSWFLLRLSSRFVRWHGHNCKTKNRGPSKVGSFDSEELSYSTKVPSDLFLTHRKYVNCVWLICLVYRLTT